VKLIWPFNCSKLAYPWRRKGEQAGSKEDKSLL